MLHIMPDSVTVLTLGNRARWDAEHAQGGLPSQSWSYAHALNASGCEPKLAIVHAGDSRMLLPFYVREFQGSTDVATILALSGASIEPSSAAPLRVWADYAKEQGWVAGYIQLAPEIELSGAAGEIVTVNEVFLLDLRRFDIAGTTDSIRQKVKLAQRYGAVVVEDREALATRISDLYRQTWRRIGAPALYDFSAESLQRWIESPDCLAIGAMLDGNIETIALFDVAGSRAEYHVNAASERGRNLSAWLICQGTERLRARHVDMLNLGGGARPGDGVHQFKRRFGASPTPLRAVRQIYDARRYKELCAKVRAGDDERWFPAYRARR